MLTFAIGQGIWTCEEVILREPPFPSLADIAFLGSYALLLPGILRLPKHPSTFVEQCSVLLDAAIMIMIIIVFSWHFVLGPTVLQATNSLLSRVIGTAYPCLDLVLLFCILLIWISPKNGKGASGLLLLSLGLIMIVVADSLFDYLSINSIYATGNIIDPLWSLGYQCVAIGVIMHQRAPRSSIQRSVLLLHTRWQNLLAYTLLLALSILILYLWHTPGDEIFVHGVYVWTIVLIGMLFMRWRLIRNKRQHLSPMNNSTLNTDTL